MSKVNLHLYKANCSIEDCDEDVGGIFEPPGFNWCCEGS